MPKLTAVVIGCGAIAREHLAALQDLKDVEVGGVCDLSPARAEATAERFGVQNWDTDYEKLLIGSVRISCILRRRHPAISRSRATV